MAGETAALGKFQVIERGSPIYPGRLVRVFGGEAPAKLTVSGNLGLLDSPTLCVVNSFHGGRIDPGADWVRATVGLVARAVENRHTIVASLDLVTYELAAIRALRDSARVVFVLDEDLAHLSGERDSSVLALLGGSWPPAPDGRFLFVAPFPPGGAPESHRQRMPARDRCVLGLSELVIAVSVRTGGVMEREISRVLMSGGNVAVCRFGSLDEPRSGNRAILDRGAIPLTPDPDGRALGPVVRMLGKGSSPLVEDEDLARRQFLGQFFTPRAVTGFVCRAVRAYSEALAGPDSSPARGRLIDPAVGEGVFLQSAFEAGLSRPALSMGVDLDDRLLPIWRDRFGSAVDPAMHLADGLVDNDWIGLRPDTFDFVLGNPPFGARTLECLLDLLHGSPPARGVREDTLPLFEEAIAVSDAVLETTPVLSGLRRMEVLRLAQSLINSFESWRLVSLSARILELESAEPDLFGGSSPSTDDPGDQARAGVDAWEARSRADFAKLRLDGEPMGRAMRDALRRLAGYPPEVLFVERFVQLARPGGFVGVIVPDGVLSNEQVQPFRDWLFPRVQLLSIVSLPWRLFTGVGANAKTSIVIMRKLRASRASSEKPLLPIGNTVLFSQEKAGAALEAHLGETERAVRDHAADLRRNS